MEYPKMAPRWRHARCPHTTTPARYPHGAPYHTRTVPTQHKMHMRYPTPCLIQGINIASCEVFVRCPVSGKVLAEENTFEAVPPPRTSCAGGGSSYVFSPPCFLPQWMHPAAPAAPSHRPKPSHIALRCPPHSRTVPTPCVPIVTSFLPKPSCACPWPIMVRITNRDMVRVRDKDRVRVKVRVRVRVKVRVRVRDSDRLRVRVRARDKVGVRAYFNKPTHNASTHNGCTQITSLVGCR